MKEHFRQFYKATVFTKGNRILKIVISRISVNCIQQMQAPCSCNVTSPNSCFLYKIINHFLFEELCISFSPWSMLCTFLLLWRSFDLLQESPQEFHELPYKLFLMTRNQERILENPKNHRTRGDVGRLCNCKSGLVTKIVYSGEVVLKPIWFPGKFHMHVTIVSAS